MSLTEFEPWRPPRSSRLSFDRWQHHLGQICGGFRARPHRSATEAVGNITARRVAGLDVADMTMTIHSVERTRRHIADDPQERCFLIFQAAGSCNLEHGAEATSLREGDCTLVASARPTRFTYDGQTCRHVSIHLPAELTAGTSRAPLRYGERIAAGEPRTIMLAALIAEANRHTTTDAVARDHRRLLFDAVRLAFRAEPDEVPTTGRKDHLATALAVVERHLSDERLTPVWLAERLDVSLRTLQRTFAEAGLGVALHIRDERLKLARQRLDEEARRSRRVAIAATALEVGFNDVSYFNRSFRDAFGLTPSAWVASVRSRLSSSSNSDFASPQDR